MITLSSSDSPQSSFWVCISSGLLVSSFLLSVHPSIQPSSISPLIYPVISPLITHPSVPLPTHLPTNFPSHLVIYLSNHPVISLFIHLSTHVSILSLCLSHPSSYPSIHPVSLRRGLGFAHTHLSATGLGEKHLASARPPGLWCPKLCFPVGSSGCHSWEWGRGQASSVPAPVVSGLGKSSQPHVMFLAVSLLPGSWKLVKSARQKKA